MRALILGLSLAMAIGTAADAKSCKDPATGKFTKCPDAAMATPATSAMATPATGAPHCVKGKPCGKSCIAVDKVCHK